MSHACVHVTIHGRVQGVGFRSWVEKNAIAQSLTGWVRNKSDGTVEAMFCGEPETVEAMVEACERGPLPANVLRVERKMPDAPPPADFKQLPTE